VIDGAHPRRERAAERKHDRDGDILPPQHSSALKELSPVRDAATHLAAREQEQRRDFPTVHRPVKIAPYFRTY